MPQPLSSSKFNASLQKYRWELLAGALVGLVGLILAIVFCLIVPIVSFGVPVILGIIIGSCLLGIALGCCSVKLIKHLVQRDYNHSTLVGIVSVEDNLPIGRDKLAPLVIDSQIACYGSDATGASKQVVSFVVSANISEDEKEIEEKLKQMQIEGFKASEDILAMARGGNQSQAAGLLKEQLKLLSNLYKQLSLSCHPDKVPESKKLWAHRVFTTLVDIKNNLEESWKKASEGVDLRFASLPPEFEKDWHEVLDLFKSLDASILLVRQQLREIGQQSREIDQRMNKLEESQVKIGSIISEIEAEILEIRQSLPNMNEKKQNYLYPNNDNEILIAKEIVNLDDLEDITSLQAWAEGVRQALYQEVLKKGETVALKEMLKNNLMTLTRTYRDLAKKYHPDKVTETQQKDFNKQVFQKLNDVHNKIQKGWELALEGVNIPIGSISEEYEYGLEKQSQLLKEQNGIFKNHIEFLKECKEILEKAQEEINSFLNEDFKNQIETEIRSEVGAKLSELEAKIRIEVDAQIKATIESLLHSKKF